MTLLRESLFLFLRLCDSCCGDDRIYFQLAGEFRHEDLTLRKSDLSNDILDTSSTIFAVKGNKKGY
jgi:hypothetical protein